MKHKIISMLNKRKKHTISVIVIATGVFMLDIGVNHYLRNQQTKRLTQQEYVYEVLNEMVNLATINKVMSYACGHEETMMYYVDWGEIQSEQRKALTSLVGKLRLFFNLGYVDDEAYERMVYLVKTTSPLIGLSQEEVCQQYVMTANQTDMYVEETILFVSGRAR